MPRRITYANSGVDRNLRTESKKELQILRETYKFSRYGEIVQLPYGGILPFGNDRYLDFQVEGVGTKVFLAQLAGKYDTIGIDGVAMGVNDVIRSGAIPFAVADNIHAQVSDPNLVREWLRGITEGAKEAECVVSSGEIGDVAELIRGLTEGKGFDLVVASIGEVGDEGIISGKNVRPGDVVIGLRSSGLHSNGISLARRILFREWGGKYEPHDIPEGLNGEIVFEALEPTKIYVKPLVKAAEECKLKAAVHITGDAYLKFDRLAKFSSGIGFEFDNFKPQPIFELVQRTASELGGTVTDEEMFKTFNMGWGFAIIVDKTETDKVMDVLGKNGADAEQIGQVTKSEGIRIFHKNKRINLD